ncbi:unnamed protein product [Gadus morhua 'NCC']
MQLLWLRWLGRLCTPLACASSESWQWTASGDGAICNLGEHSPLHLPRSTFTDTAKLLSADHKTMLRCLAITRMGLEIGMHPITTFAWFGNGTG